MARLGQSGDHRYDLVLMTPVMLASSGRRADGDVLRETFDVFEEGVCLLGPDGRLEVANTVGERLYRGGLGADLEAVAREAIGAERTANRDLSQDGRAFAVRAYPLSGRGALLYVRDVTDERDGRLGACRPRSWRRSGCSPPAWRTRSTTPPRSCWPTSRRWPGTCACIEDKLRELPETGAQELGLSDLLFEATAILQESKEGMARIHRIVRDLAFVLARRRRRRRPHDVNAAVESALTMLRNELRYRARVERELRATRLVRASAARLGQVFLNLILNAAQALDETDREAQRRAGAQLRRRRRAWWSRWRTTAAGSRRGDAAHLRVVLHHQAPRASGPVWGCPSRSRSCAAWAAR